MTWISVKKRLPKIDRTVIVCWPSGYDGTPTYAWGARLDTGDGWLWGIGGHYGVRPNLDTSYNNIEADDDYQITHWMPAPKGPFRKPRAEPPK